VVAGGAADVLDVVGAHALLAGHGVGMLRGADAEVISLEGHHARDGEEQGGIVGQEREAGVVVAALLLPEPDESFTYLLPASVLHLLDPLPFERRPPSAGKPGGHEK
jgi:hypothetical protein